MHTLHSDPSNHSQYHYQKTTQTAQQLNKNATFSRTRKQQSQHLITTSTTEPQPQQMEEKDHQEEERFTYRTSYSVPLDPFYVFHAYLFAYSLILYPITCDMNRFDLVVELDSCSLVFVQFLDSFVIVIKTEN